MGRLVGEKTFQRQYEMIFRFISVKRKRYYVEDKMRMFLRLREEERNLRSARTLF